MKIFIHPHTNNNFQVKWCCPRTELIIQEGLSKIPEVELVDSELQADFVILHHVPQNHGQKSFDLINKINPKKLIVVDSIDEQNEYFVEEFNPNNYFLYFKRSIVDVDPPTGNRTKRKLPERCFGWDYAILNEFIQPIKNKNIDIGCYLRPSCVWRNVVLNWMHSFHYPNKKIGAVSSGSRSYGLDVYFDSQYFEHLAKTKILVHASPFGWYGCSRTWEALANQCCLISNEFYDTLPNPLVPDEHYLKFNPVSRYDLYDKIFEVIYNENKLKEIAEKGHAYALNYHTAEARVKYILEKIEENS